MGESILKSTHGAAAKAAPWVLSCLIQDSKRQFICAQARDAVLRGDFAQRGAFLPALLGCIGAARVEHAAGRRIP